MVSVRSRVLKRCDDVAGQYSQATDSCTVGDEVCPAAPSGMVGDYVQVRVCVRMCVWQGQRRRRAQGLQYLPACPPAWGSAGASDARWPSSPPAPAPRPTLLHRSPTA
jgi:hypothetical protein